ncbi:MAG: recombination regulator RecX [Pseudomonadota bacterium]|jgi:regulatory protein
MTEDLKNRAVRLLARREHSRIELARKLASHGTPQEIQAVLDHLERSGLLSDARYAESFVRAKSGRFGTLKLRHELRARGVAEELIEAALLSDGDSEQGRACEVWRRKFGSPPRGAAEYARQARFLQSRGFAAEVIRRVLKNESEQ